MNSSLLEGLNEAQKEAVLYFDGPLMIVAGAGSGKTRVITHKIAYLILEKGLRPQQILGVTFTNKAANEMKGRIEGLTQKEGHGFNISTFHSLGLRMLRTAGKKVGYEGDWQIIDDHDQKAALNVIIKEKSSSFTNDMRDALRRKIGLAKMNLMYPNNRDYLLQRNFSQEEFDYYNAYYSWQQKQKRWDYEDLVSLPVKMMQSDPALCLEYSDRFNYVVVDEFQDTNPNQYEMIRLIARRHGNITIVGDDDQAIYSWRGADIRFLFDFDRDFSGAKIIKLEQNYRSTPTVLSFANQIINRNLLRKDKSMWTDKKGGDPVFLLQSGSKEEEAEWVVGVIENLIRIDKNRLPLAILYRINSQSLAFENELNQRNIPYKVLKGLRFFDRKEVKDSLSLLRLALDMGDDASFLRVIDFLPLGIGEKSQQQISGLAKTHVKPYSWVLKNHLPEKWSSRTIWRALEQAEEERIAVGYAGMLERLLAISGYLDFLKEKGEESRLLNIQELLSFIKKWEASANGASIVEFFDQITLHDPGEADAKTVPVYLLTMHNAKGLEFPTTVVVGVNSTYLPFFLRKDHKEIEEERRLFYVSCTRAISLLILSVGGGKESPFVNEVNGALFSRAFGVTDLIKQLQGESGYGQGKGSRDDRQEERYISHPIFGRGKIIEDLGRKRFIVQFVDRGEKVIDTSIVPVQFE